MTLAMAKGCQKHWQPVSLNGFWYYIWAIRQSGNSWIADLTPYGIGHVRGFGYTSVDISRLD